MRRHSRYLVLLMAMFLISPVAFVPMAGADDQGDEGVSSRQLLPMTAYMQNGTEAHYIYDYSTTYIFNTNVGNRSTFMGDVHTVSVSWYLHPLLAGDFYVNGDVTLWVYLNTTGVSANGNLKFTMKDLSYKLDATTETVEWSVDSANQQVVLQTGVNSYSVSIPAVDHTFLAGNTIAVEMEIQGGASAFFGLWYGNETYDSRIEFNAMDHLEIEDAYTLD